jgi:hypothetical protein
LLCAIEERHWAKFPLWELKKEKSEILHDTAEVAGIEVFRPWFTGRYATK